MHADELLALCASGAEALIRMGLAPLAMRAVALEKSPEHRWLAKLPPGRNARIAESLPEGVHLYAPMTQQLTTANVVSTEEEK